MLSEELKYPSNFTPEVQNATAELYKGVEKVIELDLSAEEKENFDNSIKAVKELFDAAKKIDPDLQ